MNWQFIEEDVVEALHAEQLRRHGGAQGLRDRNALASALDRPKNKAPYGTPDAHELAAAYLFDIARNHPFTDGNKRVAILAAIVFLIDNGYAVTANDAQIYEFTLSVAAGEIDENGAARFLRDFSIPIE